MGAGGPAGSGLADPVGRQVGVRAAEVLEEAAEVLEEAVAARQEVEAAEAVAGQDEVS